MGPYFCMGCNNPKAGPVIVHGFSDDGRTCENDPDAFANLTKGTDMENEHIMQFFAYAHLPPALQDVSKPFAEQADRIMTLPRNPERTVALRKLLESKDAAVRAALAK